MNAKAIFLFSAGLFFLGFSTGFGQSAEDTLYNNIESVNLIVRLPSEENKMSAMKKSLSDPELSDPARERLRAQLEKIEAETDARNKAIMEAFRTHFDALPVFFIYDTTHNPVKARFLDPELRVRELPALSEYLIQLRFGRPRADSGNQPESMVLTDLQLQDLGPPFPKPLIMTGIGYGLNKILAPETAFQRLLDKRVIKLDRQIRELLRWSVDGVSSN